MTGSQMTVFTSYNQIHCWVDQNKMKNAISFSISVLSLIVFAIAFILPTTGENRAAVAILAMVALIANQVVAILPYSKIKDWLASSPSKDNAVEAFVVWMVIDLCFCGLYAIKEQIPEAWGWIFGAYIIISVICALIIYAWAIPAAKMAYWDYVGRQRRNILITLVTPLEEQKRVIKHLNEVQRELELIHSLNEWEARQSH